MPACSVGITGFQSPCPGSAPLVFGLISAPLHRERGRRREEREGTQGSGFPNPELLKADNLCFTKRSLILPMAGGGGGGTRTKQIRQITMSREGSEVRRRNRDGKGGAGPDRDPQGRLAMSLSGGGPTGLGLLSLAFPSNIMTLVWRWRKNKTKQD